MFTFIVVGSGLAIGVALYAIVWSMAPRQSAPATPARGAAQVARTAAFTSSLL